MKHRGKDPEAIKVADNLGLLFDGMRKGIREDMPTDIIDLFITPTYYQFTIANGKGKGITFYVRELDQTEARRDEKLREFDLR